MNNQYFRIADKYAGNGMHYESSISRTGEIRQRLVCVCKVCGKDYPVKNHKQNRSACCPECRKELRKMNTDSDALQDGSGNVTEYK